MNGKELIVWGLIVFAGLAAHYYDERKRNKRKPCQWKDLG